ncbi:hypothetical protein G6F56_010939 [Rhizopus delemar]|nr:hypothetical protein G6F56_010939 [Rhizopus delemar]
MYHEHSTYYLIKIWDYNLSNKKADRPVEDTQILHETLTTEKKRDGHDREEAEEIKEIKPLKVQHRQDKQDRPISSEQELEVLRDELFKLENESKALREYNDLLDMSIKNENDELDSRTIKDIEKEMEDMKQELDEHEEYDKELSSIIQEKDKQGIEFMMARDKKDKLISDLLNQLSETKYKIVELQEQ